MAEEKILIADNERKLVFLLSGFLQEEGYEALTAHSPEEAYEKFSQEKVDAVLLDLVFDDSKRDSPEGVEVLKKMKELRPDVPVIILTGHGTISRAVECIKLGAYDFVEKPVRKEKILVVLKNALRESLLKEERNFLIEQIREEYVLVGNSPQIERIRRQIEKFSKVDSPVLIEGPSGTGKELVARLIHLKSKRASRPFIAVNCSAIPDDLIESELFGYEKGAFTGAYKEKPGMFELAHGGTLFLDEISEAAPRFQAKVLRIVEDGFVQRLGSTKKRKVDVRIISATNKPLKKLAAEGKFREDLFYRLQVLVIEIPPLSERPQDILPLLDYYMERILREKRLERKKFSPEALSLLLSYSWPGNVRELKNLLEKALIMTEGEVINPEDLEPFLEEGPQGGIPGTLKEAVELVERRRLKEELERNNWNYTLTARPLGISRATLFNKIRKYKIKKPKQQ